MASPFAASHVITASGEYSASLSLYRPGGLTATYYSGPDLAPGLASATSEVASVDLCPAGPCMASPAGSGITAGAVFSARFSGAFKTDASGSHAVSVSVGDAGDRVRMWVDNSLVIDQWSSLASLSLTAGMQLAHAGGYRDAVLDYRHASAGTSYGCRLALSDPGSSTIGTDKLYRKEASAVPARLSVEPAVTSAVASSAAGSRLTLATSGISAPVVIISRDAFGNPRASGQGDAFFVRLGSQGLAGSSVPPVLGGTHNAAYLPKRAGFASLYLGRLQVGGLSTTYYDGSVIGAGAPVLSVRSEGGVLLSGGGHPIQGRTAGAALSARWTGFIRAAERAGQGLQATYYADEALSPSLAVSSIGFASAGTVDFSSASPSPLLTAGAWGARWGGFIRVPSTGQRTFSAKVGCGDERVKLWVDGSLIVSAPRIGRLGSYCPGPKQEGSSRDAPRLHEYALTDCTRSPVPILLITSESIKVNI